MSVEVKDIQELELSYSCWMNVDVNDLENVELWRSGRVKRFWVKYCRLFMELDDGTFVEEDINYELCEDMKWPEKIKALDADNNWVEMKA